jgi:cytosine/uracil/thiamine/allantoin permease
MNDHWLVRPATVRLLWRAFIALLAAVVAAGLLVERSVHFDVESLFGFNAWYGFLACAGMILAAKALGVLIKRRDHYYEKEDFPD